MNKKLFLLILIFIIMLNPAFPSSSESSWLIQKSQEGVWQTNAQTALAILALKKDTGYQTYIDKAAEKLKTNLETCITSRTCNLKDVSLSLLALKDLQGYSTFVDETTTWLINARTMEFTEETEGWLVQIISPVHGSCKIKNTEIEQEKTVTVTQDHTPWISLSNLNPPLLTQTTENLIIDCSQLTSSDLVISLIQKQLVDGVQTYYIKEEIHGQKIVEVKFGNQCWGPLYRTSCNPETSAYVYYVLNLLQKPIDTSWIKNKQLTPLQNALLYKTTNNNNYLTELTQSKNQDGYWGSKDVYSTAMIYYLFYPNTLLENTKSWIETQKDTSSYCWPKPSAFCTVDATSAVIFSGATQLTITTLLPPPSNDTNGNGNGGNGNGACNEGYPCTTTEECEGSYDYYCQCEDVPNDGCPCDNDGWCDNKEDCYCADCFDDEKCISECNEDGICDWPSEDCTCFDCDEKTVCTTFDGCPGTCDYFSGECIDIPTDDCPIEDITNGTTTDEDGKKGKGVLFWFFMVFILLIILIAATFLAYKKGLIKFTKKKPKTGPYKPTFKTSVKKTPYQPRMQSTQKIKPTKSPIETALEKSIEDMEKLLTGGRKK